MFIEPGVSYAKGRQIYSFQIPIGYYRNRFPNPYTGNPGDSTFPEYVSIATYSMRLGGKPASPHSMPPTSDQPSSPRTPEIVRPGGGA